MDWLAQAAAAVRSAYSRSAAYLTLGNLVSISWVSIWVVICVLVFQDLSHDLVTIEPISTPKAFADDGYTPEVASRRLHDALNKYAADAGSSMRSRDVKSREELPDFVVPKIDLSLNAIASSIRSALHYGSSQRITGEFVSRDKLLLRLRLDGQEVFTGSSDKNDPDQLLGQAAAAVMDKIRPYLVAATLYLSDQKLAVEKADYIINHLKPSDVNVQWSYILKGRYLVEQNQSTEAERILRIAIAFNSDNATAHVNLGTALLDQDKFDEAIAQFERAIAIDPIFALAHAGRGLALYRMSKPDDAIREYEQAVQIDPAFLDAHLNLGHTLYTQRRFDDAIREAEIAVRLAKTKRDLAMAHTNWGNVLADKPDPKTDEAITHYQLAIKVASDYDAAHNNLGLILSRQGKLDEAIGEFQRALEIDPRNVGAKNNLDQALRDKLAAKSKKAEATKQ
jgi:tetratricopeptide (TPR) repeat protein